MESSAMLGAWRSFSYTMLKPCMSPTTRRKVIGIWLPTSRCVLNSENRRIPALMPYWTLPSTCRAAGRLAWEQHI